MLGLGLGLQKSTKLGGGLANAYLAAVIADGGTIDSVSCVHSTFTELNNVAT
jgi:hypothetical protein